MSNVRNINNETLDSLVFFSFGFTLDEDYSLIIDKIVEKAYSDATNQGAFNTKVDSAKAQLAKYGSSGAKSTLINRIELLTNAGLVFDDWHLDTCKMLLEIYDNNGLVGIFTYGNAQKWVNMSLKYLYLLNGITNNNEEQTMKKISQICRYSSEFHVPIDSYIIDVLWGKQEVELPFKDGVVKDRSHAYAIPSEYVKGWSNWNEEDYKNTWNSLKPIIPGNPLNWEAEVWIKRAKERNR